MLPILDLMIRLLCDKGRVQEALEFVRCAVGNYAYKTQRIGFNAAAKDD